MTATEFVTKMGAIALSTSELKDKDYPETLVAEYVTSYQAERIGNEETGNELLNLIQNFDLSTLRVFDLLFYEEAVQKGRYKMVGEYDTWSITIDDFSGEILWFDQDDDRVVCACAKNAELFLDAIFKVKEIFTNRIKQGVMDTEEEFDLGNDPHICALIAGGERYEDFYANLL